MSFDVTSGGTSWATFVLKTDFWAGGCSGTVETTVDGPGAIVDGRFSVSAGTFSFSGQSTSSTSASGTYAYSSDHIFGCGYFSQSGTWAARAPGFAGPQDSGTTGPQAETESCFETQYQHTAEGTIVICRTGP